MTASRDAFCFVHAADLHLDTPFRGLQALAPALAAELREASLDAFDQIVDLAIERDAAFALFAGDIYDGAERGLRAQLRFRDGLARLADAGIASFVVHGNHDPVEEGWSAIGSWPEKVTIFPSDEVAVVEVHRDRERLATVQGISYAHQETTENLALRLRRPEGPGLHVGVLHCNVQGVADGYANYSPCTIADLQATGLDYLALGHIHQRRVLAGAPGESPWIVYPGNIQARSPRSTEQEPKGAVVVHVDDAAVQTVEFVACDRVRFVEREIAIAGLEDLSDLRDALDSLARKTLSDAEGRSVVLRARLVGRGALHEGLARPDALRDLIDSLRDGAAPPAAVFFESIEDDTAPAIDEDALRKRGDFAADLLALSDELATNDELIADLFAPLSAGAPRALAEHCRALLSDASWRRVLLERARTLALDQIVDADG